MALREVLAEFKTKFDTKAIKKGIKEIKRGIQATKDFASQLSSALYLREIAAFIDTTTDMADQLAKAATSLGITAQQFGAYSFAAGQSGMSTEQLTTGLAQFQKNIVDAANGTGEAIRTFQAMGISLKDSEGNVRNVHDVFSDFAEGIKNSDSQIENVANSMRVFGESGRRMLPLLNGGAAGVEALQSEFEELGGGLTSIAGESEAFRDAMGRLNLIFAGFRARILSRILPTLQWLIDKYVEAQKITLKWIDNSKILESAMIVLGAVGVAVAIKLAIAWIAAAWPFLLAAVAVLALILVIDDLWAAIDGGKSVIGSTFDALAEALGLRIRFTDIIAEWGRWLDILLLGIERVRLALTALFTGQDIDMTGMGRLTRVAVRNARTLRRLTGGSGDALAGRAVTERLEDRENAEIRQRRRERGQRELEDTLGVQRPNAGALRGSGAGQEVRRRRRRRPINVTVPNNGGSRQVHNTFQPQFNVQGTTQPELLNAIETVANQVVQRQIRQAANSFNEDQ